jgi:hypothetical protein
MFSGMFKQPANSFLNYLGGNFVYFWRCLPVWFVGLIFWGWIMTSDISLKRMAIDGLTMPLLTELVHSAGLDSTNMSRLTELAAANLPNAR